MLYTEIFQYCNVATSEPEKNKPIGGVKNNILHRDSLVGIALGYGLDDRGSRFRYPAESGNFSLHHSVQNGSGAHPSSYPMSNRGSFPGGKATEA
jgi:hypothetical protein